MVSFSRFTAAAALLSAFAVAAASATDHVLFPNFNTLTKSTPSPGVLSIVINNTYSDINLFDVHIMSDLHNLLTVLQNDTSTKVVVFSSANPDFFFAHIDLNALDPNIPSPIPSNDPGFPTLTIPGGLMWRLSQLPQATIGLIEGRARGIGNEFLLALDMRYSTTAPSVLFGQFEISVGVFPGGGGAIYLPKLIGRGLAFEYIFSGQDIDATTAQEFGWINRAFKTSQQLHTFVWSLAKRIALFPDAGRTAAKRVINENSGPTFAQFQSMHDQFFAAAAGKGYTELEPRFMELTANQTRGKGELDLGEELLKMYE